MNICFGNRSAETVKIYFKKVNTPEIKAVLPQRVQTIEEALENYRKTLLSHADSYGRTIIVDGNYIGDIWCYGISAEESNAMLSYCIFERTYWSHGIATRAVAMFLKEIETKYHLSTVGAFTFSDNAASIRVLEKNGFSLKEEFTEDGRASKYFEYIY